MVTGRYAIVLYSHSAVALPGPAKCCQCISSANLDTVACCSFYSSMLLPQTCSMATYFNRPMSHSMSKFTVSLVQIVASNCNENGAALHMSQAIWRPSIAILYHLLVRRLVKSTRVDQRQVYRNLNNRSSMVGHLVGGGLIFTCKSALAMRRKKAISLAQRCREHNSNGTVHTQLSIDTRDGNRK